MYPGGTVSVAVQVVPVVVVNAFTVKTAGPASEASNGDVTTDPDVHDRLTDTLAELCGENSLRTVNVFEFSVLVIVHVPVATEALQVPELALALRNWILGGGARHPVRVAIHLEDRRGTLRRASSARNRPSPMNTPSRPTRSSGCCRRSPSPP